jgi:hypothetical protein
MISPTIGANAGTRIVTHLILCFQQTHPQNQTDLQFRKFQSALLSFSAYLQRSGGRPPSDAHRRPGWYRLLGS